MEGQKLTAGAPPASIPLRSVWATCSEAYLADSWQLAFNRLYSRCSCSSCSCSSSFFSASFSRACLSA